MSGLWLPRLRSEMVAALGLAALVFATALFAALGPRVLEQRADAALHTELGAAPPFERTLVIYETARGAARPVVELDDMVALTDDLAEQLPPAASRLVVSRSTLVETPLWDVWAGSQLDSVLRLRIQPGIFERLRLVSGRLPANPPTATRDERPTARPDQFAYLYEAIIPASAADEMGIGEGATLRLNAWLSDQLNSGVNLGASLVVVGTYELLEPDEDYWLVTDNTVAGWRLHTVGTNDFLETTALLAPNAYQTMTGTARSEDMALLYQHRFFTDTDLIAAEQVGPTISALRRVEASMPRSGISTIPSDTRLSWGLLRLLEGHQRTWRAAEAVLAVIGLGVLAIAVATLGVVTVVASGGRRRVAALLRARGATPGQLLRGAGLEAVLLALPAVALAVLLATLLAPATAIVVPLALAGLVVVVSIVLLLAVVLRGAAVGQAGGWRTRVVGRLTGRRLVGEASLIVAALGAAWLLRERGISAAGGPDLLIAAVLALVGLAAGLLAMRLYPLPARLIGWLVAQRRDLLPVLAVRRAIRGGSSAAVLLLLVATASVGAFGSATLTNLETGARATAWLEVGAEHRVTTSTQALPDDFEPAGLPGVEAAALGSLRSVQVGSGTAWLLVVEPAALSAVLSDTPVEPALPAEMFEPAADRVPVVAGGLGLRAGQELEANIVQQPVPLRVSRTVDTFAGVPPGQAFIVASAEQLGAHLHRSALRPSLALLRAEPAAAAELRAALAEIDPGLALVSRSEREAELLGAPVIDALRALVGAATLLALAYAALAVAAALALAAAAQRDEHAHLRALGLGRRGGWWLTLLEYGPAAIIGFLLGAGLGLALFAFIVPALGLAAILGSPIEPPAGLSASHVLGLLAASLLILVIGWLVGVVAQRDTEPASAIRRGIE